MDIARVRHTDERVRQSVGDAHLQVSGAMKDTPLAVTSGALASLVDALGDLKAGILDSAESDNAYATFALFRVFLEHVLRALAIFQMAISEDNPSDEFAEKYYRLRIKEAFDYLRACESAGLELRDSPKSILDDVFDEARSLSNTKVKELEKPFQYRALIKLIRESIDSDSPDFLSKIIPNYGELSGFVHGGPSARVKLNHLKSAGLTEAELLRVADLSVAMYASSYRWLLVMASAFCPQFNEPLDRLNKAHQ